MNHQGMVLKSVGPGPDLGIRICIVTRFPVTWGQVKFGEMLLWSRRLSAFSIKAWVAGVDGLPEFLSVCVVETGLRAKGQNGGGLFSPRGIWAPRGRLAMSGDVFDCHHWKQLGSSGGRPGVP